MLLIGLIEMAWIYWMVQVEVEVLAALHVLVTWLLVPLIVELEVVPFESVHWQVQSFVHEEIQETENNTATAIAKFFIWILV